MNKKTIYIASFFVLSLIPFICTFFFQTDESIENRTLKEFPQILVEENDSKELNFDFLNQLGDYFNDIYAFKSYIVSIDALIQTRIFKTSNIDTVVYGNNGWLYYKSSCNDYMNSNTVSEREAFNIAHNIFLLQKYVKNHGANFALTIAPNKNSLYYDNMPYYYIKGNGSKNIDIVSEFFKNEGINYVDLFSAFSNEDEILYLKRDSHWNNKGAVLAYDELLTGLGKSHNKYLAGKVYRIKDENGDLNRILHPKFAENEYNFKYDIKDSFEYITDTKSVEDSWIETQNLKQENNLLMFRDSFGNSLLPLFANNFKSACFSKILPYNVEKLIKEHPSDYVIVEKVERNLTDFSTIPPLFTAEEINISKKIETSRDNSKINFDVFEDNINYYKISGSIESDISDDARIYLTVNNKTYEAFCVSDENSDFGYTLYLDKDVIIDRKVNIKLIVCEKNKFKLLSSAEFSISDAEVK